MAGRGTYEISAEKFHFKVGELVVKQCESRQLFANIDSLHKLYINKIGLDFEIHVLERQNRKLRLPLHKIVLAAHVDKLDPKLGSEIDLTGPEAASVNWALVQPVIEFMYTRRIFVSESNVQDLLAIAKVLRLKTLRECCVSFIKKASDTNVIRYLTWAKVHDLSELTEPLLKYAASHLPGVLKSPEVQFLDADTLRFFLENEEARSQGEIIPLTALALWLGRNDKEGKVPKDQKLKLTKLINLKRVSLQDLQKVMEDHLGVLAIDECKKALFHDIKEKLFSSNKNWALRIACSADSLHETKLLPQDIGEDFVCAIVFQSSKQKDPKILIGQSTGLLELSWLSSTRSPMQSKINNVPGAMILHRAAVVLENRLYLLGGVEPCKQGLAPSQPSNSAVCYDFKQAQWLALAPMLQERHNFGVTTSNGLLYAIGGQGKGIRTLSSCESYIPREDRWVQLTALSQGRVGIGVAAHQGSLISAGGFAYVNGAKTALTTVELYDLAQHRWKRLNSLSGQGFAFCSLVEVNGHVYAIGGASMTTTRGPLQSLDTILEYSETTDAWSSVAKLNTARHYAGIAVLGNKFYIIGGINNNKIERSVECFQIATQHVTTLVEALPVPVTGSNSCAAFSKLSTPSEQAEN